MNGLKPYMASGGEPQDGAILVFAHNIKEAKKVAWSSNSFLSDVCDSEYINLRVVYLKESPHLFTEGDKEKLLDGTPHIIETPATCKDCNLWGYELDEDGYCEFCAESK
jgi:hypothetical protein